MEGRQLMSLNVFSVPSGTGNTAITKGPNGDLFFTETAANKFGEVTPAGVVTAFTISTPISQPTSITTGPDGNIYFPQTSFTASGELEIGRITPAGKLTEIRLGGSIFEVGVIMAGPDGNVYFTETDTSVEAGGRTPA
jgi:virginiamycin B lyase